MRRSRHHPAGDRGLNRRSPGAAAALSIRILTIALLSVTILTRATAAQPTARVFRPGEVAQRIRSLTDSSQTYALYLPSAYDTAAAWPILFAMDPRGRALIPLSLFREAAERLGYIVMSSYNTASDVAGDASPNEPAFTAMLEDAQQFFALHPNRVYLTGFSGTARVSWLFARRLPGAAAGIILAGAGLPTPLADEILVANWDTSLAVFGAAGRWDFNYEEVLDLDGQLDRTGFPHHVRFFDGPHAWFPDSLASEALEYMDLQAMKRGLLPTDSGFIRAQARRRLGAAERAQQDEDPYTAWRWYRSALDDLDRLIDLPEAREAYHRLSGNRLVRRERERRDKTTVEYYRQLRLFGEFREQVRTASPPPNAAVIADGLGIDRLERSVEENAGTYEGDAARRVLESIFVSVSFYDPRTYLDAEDWPRALVVLELAHRIRPEHPRVCFDLARVYARTGASLQAVDALTCALAGGQLNADAIRGHPDLQTLQGRDDFQALLARLQD